MLFGLRLHEFLETRVFDVQMVQAKLSETADDGCTGSLQRFELMWTHSKKGTLNGAGGQNRTGYARLFRAALYQ